MTKRRIRLSTVKQKTGLNGRQIAEKLGLNKITVYRWDKVGIPPHRANDVRALYKTTGHNKPQRKQTVRKNTGSIDDKLALIELISRSSLDNEVKLRTINSLTH